MYIEAIVLGFLIGKLRRGRLSNFLGMRFKGWYLTIAALVLFLIPYLLRLLQIEMPMLSIFPFAAMLLCGVVALINLRVPGMKLFLLGLLLNLLIMGVNGFQMPIDTAAMTELGYSQFVESIASGEVLNYRPLEGTIGLSLLLAKVHKLPAWYPLSTVISIGDLLACIGIAWMIQQMMVTYRKGSMLNFSFGSSFGRN
ncbi:MAG: DUF5317 family protein [Bacillota bacterium]|nr:DUF5317 family protein [Bacillota bacterium]